MIELNELSQEVDRMLMLFKDPEYFQQWFTAEEVVQAQLRAVENVLPQLIADWKMLRTREGDRNAPSK